MRCQREGESLKKVSPFLIRRMLSAFVVGELKSAKKLRDGTLLIETANETQSKKLLTMKLLNDIPVVVEPHRTLNTCRGIITHYDLLHVEVEEIQREMASQGVIHARRLTTKRNGEIINTTSVVLTFSFDSLPEKVFIGYESVPVRPFIPAPMRCFQCQRFGHVATRCEGKPTCPRCGLEKHEDAECSKDPHCVNCEGAHPVYSRNCPKVKEERQVMEIKTREKLSYFDARKKYRELVAPTFSRSFASVVTAVKKCSIGIQTEKACNEKPKAPIIQSAEPVKASKPALKTKTSGADSSMKNQPKTTGSTPGRREKTPSPGPSGPPQPESMEEDEALSESEVLRIRALAKKQKRRIKR
jgi:hypothetical protein